ncbi:hypothetical protein E4U60_000654 [Claviceps pazoutovae]|uniref:Phosphatidate phosphatase APP1 catalytic domain-containing protein n=1 Tax=Claviceps pazoutovae TaxID=1649127 RepID=A0A9P7MEH4_9HYPO|nr:hypothetical protein E4U60_000654 [Claviceps pazoutovae]
MAYSESSLPNLASVMQLRTRKAQEFAKVESSLQEAQNIKVPQEKSDITSWLTKLSIFRPFAKPVSDNEIVWLLDNTAFKCPCAGVWQAEFVAAVFKRHDKLKVIDMVSSVLRAVGLTDDAPERKRIEERVLPFLWDICPGKIVTAVQQSSKLNLGPSSANGLSLKLVAVPNSKTGSLVSASTKLGGGIGSITEMQTFYAGEGGWGVISGMGNSFPRFHFPISTPRDAHEKPDIDDTIKVTMTSDPVGILRETFVNTPSPIVGMPELYAEIKSFLPQDTAWFYLSASPYNLYPFLKQFRKQYYPPGTLILRDSSWKTIAGLLTALTVGTQEYKVDRMKKVCGWFPMRKMIAIGDSTQSDPEAYGEFYRSSPNWIRLILIRKATNIAEIGIDEKNKAERFEAAFKGVPRHAWHVFEDPAECVDIVKRTIREGQ